MFNTNYVDTTGIEEILKVNIVKPVGKYINGNIKKRGVKIPFLYI